MQPKALATDLGEALKYDTTIKEIERVAAAILPCSRQSFPNPAITSKCSFAIYEWVLSVSKYTIPDERKVTLIVDFAKRLAPTGKIPEIAELFKRNGVSERHFDGMAHTITPPPSFAKLTANMPGLDAILQARWIEAQKCQNAGGYLSSVIMMGSILEGLLLGRVDMSKAIAHQAKCAPKNKKTGANVPIQDWKLNDLIEVAVECGWIKLDRGSFSHALRSSRNIVHPWAQLALKADFDHDTCATCWQVLKAAVNDLSK